MSETEALHADGIMHHRARIRTLRPRLSNRLRIKISRLASHLNRSEDDVLEDLLFSAAADCARRAVPRGKTADAYESLWSVLDAQLLSEAAMKRFELRFLRYHLRHKQRMVRPTWASILVTRLSNETCALWVKVERYHGGNIRLPFHLREVVYLPDEAFQTMEREVLREILRQREDEIRREMMN